MKTDRRELTLKETSTASLLSRLEALNEDTYEAYSRPIDPTEWGVIGQNAPGRGQRATLVVFLPADADQALIHKLDSSLNASGMEIRGDNRIYWVEQERVRQIKLDLAAKIIRGWKERIGWATWLDTTRQAEIDAIEQELEERNEWESKVSRW